MATDPDDLGQIDPRPMNTVSTGGSVEGHCPSETGFLASYQALAGNDVHTP